MCYMRRKIEGGVGALRESDDTNILKPNGGSRNLNIYVWPIFYNVLRYDGTSSEWQQVYPYENENYIQ